MYSRELYTKQLDLIAGRACLVDWVQPKAGYKGDNGGNNTDQSHQCDCEG